MQLVMRILPRAKYITRALPIKEVNPPLDSFGIRRFLCVESSAQNSSENPPASIPQQRSKHTILTFLEKVLDSYKLINLLNERPWNEDTPNAVQGSNAKLSPYVLSLVIKLCVDLDTALEFYKWSMKTVDNISECVDSHVYVALMHCLGTAGRIEEMQAVASECESNGMATVDTFAVQLVAYKNISDLDGALRTWKRVEKFGLKPNLTSYIALMTAFATFRMYDEAADLFLLFLWEKDHPNAKMLTIFIHHLALAGKMDSAMIIFNDMVTLKARPNAMTYATLMKGYAILGDSHAVMNLVQEFNDMGFRPHRGTFKILFEDMIREGKKEDALKVMHKLWPGLSVQDLNGLILYYQGGSKNDRSNEHDDMYCISEASDMSDDDEDRENSEEDSENSSPDPNCLWNFSGFVRCLCPWTAASAAALEHAKIKWNGHLVSEIIKRFKIVDAGWKFFTWVEGQQGFTHDKFTYMAMIELLLQDGKLSIVKQLLLEAQSKQLSLPLYTYNKVLKICGMRREVDVALDVFGLLKSSGLKLNSRTYHTLIEVLYRCGRFWRAATVFAEMEKAGFAPSATTYSYVTSGFAEAGQMKYARAFYAQMRASGFEPSSQLFGAFIRGFYLTGRLDRAEQVFQQMRKDGMEPSGEVYDLMINKVFRRTGKKAELHQVKRDRESRIPLKFIIRQQTFDKYLKFYQIFKESLAECNDNQLYATG